MRIPAAMSTKTNIYDILQSRRGSYMSKLQNTNKVVKIYCNYSPGVQLPHGRLRSFPLKSLDQGVQQVDVLLA